MAILLIAALLAFGGLSGGLQIFTWSTMLVNYSQTDGLVQAATDTFSEVSTSGYALLHLRLGRVFAEKLRVEAGVENVFDKAYANHHSGINRVPDSAVPVGERISGPRRFFYLNANFSF